MMIHGFAPSPIFKSETGLADRFWFWRGASGRSYIHTIYALDGCPPLPGAVFVAVRRLGPLRTALAAGRLPVNWDPGLLRGLGTAGATEIHLHLLAEDDAEAEAVAADLGVALEPGIHSALAA